LNVATYPAEGESHQEDVQEGDTRSTDGLADSMIRGAGSDNNHGARHQGAANHEESAAVETVNQAETSQRGDHHDRGL
jgi:hypothetical protein